MIHVDSSREPRLERIMSEIRTHRKRVASEQQPERSMLRRASARSAEALPNFQSIP